MHGGPTDRLMVVPPPSLFPFSRGGRNFEAEFVSLYKVRRNAAVAAAVVAVCKRAGAVVIHADLAAAVARPTAHFLPAMLCNGYKVREVTQSLCMKQHFTWQKQIIHQCVWGVRMTPITTWTVICPLSE